MGRDFVDHTGKVFGYTERDQPATQVHDPLTLQATALPPRRPLCHRDHTRTFSTRRRSRR